MAFCTGVYLGVSTEINFLEFDMQFQKTVPVEKPQNLIIEKPIISKKSFKRSLVYHNHLWWCLLPGKITITQWRHFSPNRRLCPPSEEKSGQNQPFLAIFLILTLQNRIFPPRCPPHKKFLVPPLPSYLCGNTIGSWWTVSPIVLHGHAWSGLWLKPISKWFIVLCGNASVKLIRRILLPTGYTIFL